MRKTLVASSVAAVLATVPNDEYGQAFKNFETANARNYASEQERSSRFDIFKSNYIYIASENAKNDNSYELGVNEFSDMTPEEFAGTHFGYVKAAQRFQGTKNLGVHEYKGEALPTSVDWRSKGAVTPVKNQASCGSCWAFSTTGSMEGAWAIASGKLVSLSEEQLVACSKQNHGCQGGSMELGFMYEEGTAVCTEQSYPYTSGGGSVGACKASSCTAGIPKGGITGYKTIASNKNSLMSAVAQQPTSIAVEADKSVFQSYRSGVMTGMCGTNLDHGILAIGYGTESGKDYWLVKNSWGTSWGEAGYGKLERGKGGTGECGILSDDSYPVASDTSNVVNDALEQVRYNGKPFRVQSGGDPAGSWLSYAAYKAPKGGLINRVNTSWTVPTGKPTSGGSNAPGWWYGVQTAAGNGALVQPILACDYMGSSCREGTYVIFDGVYDWTTPSHGMYESKIISAKAGDKINSWLSCTAAECTQYIENARTSQGATFPYKLHNPSGAEESVLYFVLEHQPSSCAAFPPKGVCTFTDIYVEVDGKAVTPQWEAKQERPACGSEMTVIDSKTLAITWNGGTPPSPSSQVVV